MCGRFTSHLPPDAIRTLFATSGAAPNLAPNWNVAPSNDAMVIRRHAKTGERQLDLLRWGLIPLRVENNAGRQAALRDRPAGRLTVSVCRRVGVGKRPMRR